MAERGVQSGVPYGLTLREREGPIVLTSLEGSADVAVEGVGGSRAEVVVGLNVFLDGLTAVEGA